MRSVLDQAPVALVAFDADGVITFVGGALIEGGAQAMVGRPFLELATGSEEVEALRAALAGQSATRVLPRGGRYWQVRFRPLDGGGVVQGTLATFNDVTRQVRAEQSRASGAAQLQALVAAAHEGILMLDAEGRVIIANAHAARLAGAPLPPGTPLGDILTGQAADALRAGFGRRAAGVSDRYELALEDAEGRELWVLVSGSPMQGAGGEFLGSVAVLTDITATKLEQHRLEGVALVDALTGVPNRATLADRLEHALSRRSAGVVAVLFCDVDRLKATNDRYGHATGDLLLSHVAHRISSVLRPADSLARYGGDEFVIVCEELHVAREAVALADRVRAAVLAPLTTGDAVLQASVSVGVATSPPELDAAGLLAAADRAAYAAKRGGRNTVRVAP